MGHYANKCPNGSSGQGSHPSGRRRNPMGPEGGMHGGHPHMMNGQSMGGPPMMSAQGPWGYSGGLVPAQHYMIPSQPMDYDPMQPT